MGFLVPSAMSTRVAPEKEQALTACVCGLGGVLGILCRFAGFRGIEGELRGTGFSSANRDETNPGPHAAPDGALRALQGVHRGAHRHCLRGLPRMGAGPSEPD